jgi:hypothetical protein
MDRWQGKDSRMMGKQQPQEARLFYYGLSLDQRVPHDHLLRKVRTMVDFDFPDALAGKHYGVKGNVSVPPPVLLKLMLLLFLYDVPSERELMRSLPYCLDRLCSDERCLCVFIPEALGATGPVRAERDQEVL